MSFFLTSLCGLDCVLAAKWNLTCLNCRCCYRIFFGPGFETPRLHQTDRQTSTYYCDGNVFGIICDATKYLEEACLQYGYKYYHGKKIEGAIKWPSFL